MREICTSGSVGGLGRPIVAASGLPDAADDPPDACALPHRERRTTANEREDPNCQKLGTQNPVRHCSPSPQSSMAMHVDTHMPRSSKHS
jgi:hypothetical protein